MYVCLVDGARDGNIEEVAVNLLCGLDETQIILTV